MFNSNGTLKPSVCLRVLVSWLLAPVQIRSLEKGTQLGKYAKAEVVFLLQTAPLLRHDFGEAMDIEIASTFHVLCRGKHYKSVSHFIFGWLTKCVRKYLHQF